MLHQLAEDFRSRKTPFSKNLWWEAQWATSQLLPDGLNVRTIGTQPKEATVLACVCKQAWSAWCCQPRDQCQIVESLLEWNCDPDLRSARGDTVLMEMAGAGHVNMFKFWYTQIVKIYWSCDLEARNVDGRNRHLLYIVYSYSSA